MCSAHLCTPHAPLPKSAPAKAAHPRGPVNLQTAGLLTKGIWLNSAPENSCQGNFLYLASVTLQPCLLPLVQCQKYSSLYSQTHLSSACYRYCNSGLISFCIVFQNIYNNTLYVCTLKTSALIYTPIQRGTFQLESEYIHISCKSTSPSPLLPHPLSISGFHFEQVKDYNKHMIFLRDIKNIDLNC